ncbi:PP2C family protein-serine/threonine phosphatase [Streptomyces sp. L7]
MIGSELDLRLTGTHVVARADARSSATAASVYLLERWVLEENATPSVDPAQIEARRLAVRVGTRRRRRPGTVCCRSVRSSSSRARRRAREALADRAHPGARRSGRAHLAAAAGLRGRGRAAHERPAEDGVLPRGAAPTARLRHRFHRLHPRPGAGHRSLPGEAVAVESLAARACVALDNARRYERERRTALAIRNSLLPDPARQFPGCRIAHGYLPAGQGNIIGGDWFDVLPRPGGRVGLVVGDAMGHGPDSAVAMIQLRTAVRALARLDMEPAELMRRLDELAYDTPGRFLRHLHLRAEWDGASRTCTLVGAGPPSPTAARTRGTGRARRPRRRGTAAGTGHRQLRSHGADCVSEPSLLLLYSDGLVESRHADIDQEIARLAAALDTAAAEPAPSGGPDAFPGLCERLLRSPAAAPGADDRTLLLAELTPATT